MKLSYILTISALLSLQTYSQTQDLTKKYEGCILEVKERLGKQVNLFVQNSGELKEKFGIEEKDYFISATSLHAEKKDTLYFLKNIEDEELKKINELCSYDKIYSLKIKDEKNPDSDKIANYIIDRIIGVDEKEKVEKIFFLNEILSVYPNPTNSYSNIIIDLPFNVNSLEGTIYDITGREVKKFDLENSRKKGEYRLNQEFDSNIASGTYIFHLKGTTNDKYFVSTKKILLLK